MSDAQPIRDAQPMPLGDGTSEGAGSAPVAAPAKTASMHLVDGAIEPRNFEELRALANGVAASELCPQEYQGKPGKILVAWNMGAEVGLPRMFSLQRITVLHKRPRIYGDAIRAIARAQGCLVAVETEGAITMDEKTNALGGDYTVRATVKDANGVELASETFSVLDAKIAGLWGRSGPWSQYPKRMILARAVGFAVQDAGLLAGLTLADDADHVYSPTRLGGDALADDAFEPLGQPAAGLDE